MAILTLPAKSPEDFVKAASANAIQAVFRWATKSANTSNRTSVAAVDASLVTQRRDALASLDNLHNAPVSKALDTATPVEPSVIAHYFAETLYQYAELGAEQQGAVAIIQHLDGLLHAGLASDCNEILKAVQIDRLPPRMYLALLTVTNLIPPDDLPEKPHLRTKVRERLVTDVGPERAVHILGDP